MEINVLWSELAQKQLREIYYYYAAEVSSGVAKRIVNKLINRVEILYLNPLSGPRELLLSERSEDFRYLVESNYKIIYWVDNNVITIATVFDCRCNPIKMKEI